MASKKSNKKENKGITSFPAKLVAPIGEFLQDRLKQLESRKKDIEEEDRLLDNAAPDADAAEQFGHARTTAINKQIDKKIIQTKKALARIKVGKYGMCEDCGNMIDTDRLVVYPEATLCAECQSKRE